MDIWIISRLGFAAPSPSLDFPSWIDCTPDPISIFFPIPLPRAFHSSLNQEFVTFVLNPCTVCGEVASRLFGAQFVPMKGDEPQKCTGCVVVLQQSTSVPLHSEFGTLRGLHSEIIVKGIIKLCDFATCFWTLKPLHVPLGLQALDHSSQTLGGPPKCL